MKCDYLHKGTNNSQARKSQIFKWPRLARCIQKWVQIKRYMSYKRENCIMLSMSTPLSHYIYKKKKNQ